VVALAFSHQFSDLLKRTFAGFAGGNFGALGRRAFFNSWLPIIIGFMVLSRIHSFKKKRE